MEVTDKPEPPEGLRTNQRRLEGARVMRPSAGECECKARRVVVRAQKTREERKRVECCDWIGLALCWVVQLKGDAETEEKKGDDS